MKRQTLICQISHVSVLFIISIATLLKYSNLFTLQMSNLNLASKNADDEPQKVKAAVYLNIALCQTKLKNYYEVKKAVS